MKKIWISLLLITTILISTNDVSIEFVSENEEDTGPMGDVHNNL